MQNQASISGDKAVKKTELSLVFTPEEIDRLKSLPPLPKKLEERMRLIANIMIDRVLKDRKRDQLKAK